MTEQFCAFVGIDWATEKHRVCLLDVAGKILGERSFAHTGRGLAELCDWLIGRCAARAEEIAVAIEVPHGPVVEALLERGFAVHSLNPKQLDRFRDRLSVAAPRTIAAMTLSPAMRSGPTGIASGGCGSRHRRSSNCVNIRAWPTT